MNQIKDAKNCYDNIPISPKLEEMVAQTIKTSHTQLQHEPSNNILQNKWSRYGLAASACFLAGFIFLVNVNTAFAAELQKIPVLGSLVRLVSISSYQEQNDSYGISVNIPSIEQIGEENTAFSQEINKEIYNACQQYTEAAIQRALEYKDAFLSTGGTKEEWLAHHIEITVDYEIKKQNENFLSFVVTGTENWSSAYASSTYYNLDLQKMQLVSLQDLLGEDYIRIANESIQKQIEQRLVNPEEAFFTVEEGGFETISAEQPFYINEAGNPVIVFEKYEIAPGFMGAVEFEIVD